MSMSNGNPIEDAIEETFPLLRQIPEQYKDLLFAYFVDEVGMRISHEELRSSLDSARERAKQVYRQEER